MKRAALGVLIAAILIVDQLTKYLARRMTYARSFGPLTLTYTENRGSFLSLGENLPPELRAWIFTGLVAVGLAIVGVFLARNPDAPLALVFAGGVGNLIDRLRFQGRVTDFLYLHVGPVHTGIFNVADMAITFGAIWLLLAWGRPSSDRPKNVTTGG